MSAVHSQTWSIDPTIDLQNATAEIVERQWHSAFDHSVLGELNYLRRSLIDIGETEQAWFNITLDKTARTMERHRQFFTLEAANEYGDWIQANLPVTAGAFQQISSTVQATSLLDMGLSLGYTAK